MAVVDDIKDNWSILNDKRNLLKQEKNGNEGCLGNWTNSSSDEGGPIFDKCYKNIDAQSKVVTLLTVRVTWGTSRLRWSWYEEVVPDPLQI